MTITPDELRRARYMCEPAAAILLEILRPDKRGRKTLAPIIFLTGMQLSIDHYNVATLTKIHRVLTRDLSRKMQWSLGVLSWNADGTVRTMTIHDLYNVSRRITKMLDFTIARTPWLPASARERRERRVEALVKAILEPTLIKRPEGSRDYALDGTGIWASEKGSRKPLVDLSPPDHEEDLTALDISLAMQDTCTDTDCETQPEPKRPNPGQGQRGESDAHWGAKTAKNGVREPYFGYDVQGLVRAPALSTGPKKVRTEPNLLEKLVVLPASKDIVGPCLRLIDQMTDEGKKIESLLVDRHYSYKKYDRWLNELLKRGIDQVCDMTEADQGFTDWDGLKMASGFAHCPSTPNSLGNIPSLSPDASHEENRAFNAKIKERHAYAAKRINPLSLEGKVRFGCPALNGTLGCPLRAGTVATAIELNLPIIAEPPAEIGRPNICNQQSVQIRVVTTQQKKIMKLAQRFYWGHPNWRLSYARRTFVESFFGVLKSPTATGYDRGSHQFTGLPMVSVVLAMAAATTNLRLLRKWDETTKLGDAEHPLLQPDKEYQGFDELTKEQADQIDEDARNWAA